MKKAYCYTLLLLLGFTASKLQAQKPEKQISFAQESKPHSYYVEQAKLWWLEVQKDSLSENNWYNYFRACRNSQGSANWKSDFVNESPYLKTGPDIVALMQKHIPGTFMYYYLSYLDRGIGVDNGDNLLKAYEMNPNFEGIHSSMVTYSVSSLDPKLRKQVNKEWYKTNYLSPQLLAYGYNTLMSVGTNGILITQNDNDTYPLWMLQDVLGIREDVDVVNVDFMLIDSYRNAILKMADVVPMHIEDSTKKTDVYELNWGKIVKHVLANYTHQRPLYLNMTLYQSLYDEYKDQLDVSGIAFKYCREKENFDIANIHLYENVFCLDYLTHAFYHDRNQEHVNYDNLNYLNLLKNIYDSYITMGQGEKAANAKKLAILLAERINNEEFIKAVNKEFNG